MTNMCKVNLNNGTFVQLDDDGIWSGNSENMGQISPQTMLDLIIEHGIEGWTHGGHKKDVNYEVDIGNLYSHPIYFNTYHEAKLYYDNEKQYVSDDFIGLAKITREELHSEFIPYEEEVENASPENLDIKGF